jgi:hypothetical protein
MSIVTPLIGASLTQVWKPVNGVTVPPAAADAQAPFALGTTVWSDGWLGQPAVSTGRTAAVFCRVGATGIAAGATAGITAGVTVAAAAGNTFTNNTGQALVTGDYAFLTAQPAILP